MVSGSRIEGGPQIVSAGVRKTIQSIKEIVGNHSDAEIYSTLKETNMDPNETAQKLLNQDPFHEVKRKREKKKEVLPNMVYNAPEPKMSSEPENNAHSDRNIRRGRFTRNSLHDAKVIREFRIVKDNRTNHHTDNKIKPPVQSQLSPNETEVQKFPSKSSANMPSSNQKQLVERHSSKSLKGVADSQPRQARDVQLNDKKDMAEDRHALVTKAGQQMQTTKSNDLQLNSTSSNNSVAGIYSSSSDPVHVPSPDSRPAANIGAIKREVGAVGVRRLSTEISAKSSSTESCSVPNLHLGHDDLSRDSFQSSAAMHKSSQPTQNHVRESVVTGLSVTRPIANNQYSSRQNQSGGHQKASSHSNKEWKPKFSKRQSSSPGVVEMASQSAPPPADASKSLEVESTQLQDKLSQVNISENENVIIAPHIRVPVTDRYRVTFGSMGTEYEPSRNPGFEAVKSAEKSYADPSASVSVATTESSGDESSGNKQVKLIEQSVRNSGSSSPASAVSEQQLTERKESESSSPQDLNNYADVGLVGNNHPYFNPYDSQLPQDHSPVPQLPNISAYDPQTVYDIPYFRSMVDETARVQSLQFPQEAISSHTVNNISSSVAMVQQPPQLTQMYPQVHVSHYANLMPYRQFISPVYVPPMAVPAGYSNNPAYPHPSNGNSYLMMPGGSSHLPTSGLKYGVQQFKPAPTGSPTGFGNFTGPNGYAINAPGVGSATGLDDSSRLKYKDGNLYVPNPQTETSEIWMSSRDLLPSMQSGSYYNMSGQTPPATYLHSPSSHGSFNAAGQSSHMQFPGMYHTQPTGIHSPHLLSPAMGGNVGVGVAAGGPPTQVNAYQQPQLGHMNWTGNF